MDNINNENTERNLTFDFFQWAVGNPTRLMQSSFIELGILCKNILILNLVPLSDFPLNGISDLYRLFFTGTEFFYFEKKVC